MGRWTCAAWTCIRSTSCRTCHSCASARTSSASACRRRACRDSDLWVYLVDCPALFDRPRIYSDAPDEHVRYLMLTRAALECCQRMGFAPQIVHSNDWHTAFAPLLLRTAYAWDTAIFGGARSRVHHPQHRLPGRVLGGPGRGPRRPASASRRCTRPTSRAGRVNPMRHGVLYADAVTTVSPTYADEIRTVEGGHGLDGDLRARGAAVSGILNGVDYDEWNPATDRYIPYHYDADDLSGKARNKEALLDLLRMPAPADDAADRHGDATHARRRASTCCSTRCPRCSSAATCAWWRSAAASITTSSSCTRLQERFPGRAVFYSGYSEELAHFIEAAADIFLMPSMYEPCGLNQMYSLKYGTVPIVRRTGGLADSVQHFDPATGTGTGIVFNDFDAAACAGRWPRRSNGTAGRRCGGAWCRTACARISPGIGRWTGTSAVRGSWE